MGKSEPVFVNVYDLHWTNKYTLPIGLGIFHSGIEVYGVEYAYGGHRFDFSGIFDITPRNYNELGPTFRYRESILIGHTECLPEEICCIVEELGDEFCGNRYHLMSKNCNHFTNCLAQILCGRGIPNWINRLARYSLSVPFLMKFLPQDWLTPNALQQYVRQP